MPIASETPPPTEAGAKKTGRRANPAIDGPRDRTVCFMLSEAEKEAVDRLAFCMNLTRSGILAKIVADFVRATETSKDGRNAEKQLAVYLTQCRTAVKKRGTLADEALPGMKGKNQ